MLTAVAAPPLCAEQRTFLLAPADLVAMIDDFNAAVLDRSGSLGRGVVAIRRGAVSLARKPCPSLSVSMERTLARIRVLDSPTRAALLAGRRAPNNALGDALALMGGTAWGPVVEAQTLRESWLAEDTQEGVAEFVAPFERIGSGAGTIDGTSRADTRASFLVRLEAGDSPAIDGIPLVFALTTSIPPRFGRRSKQTECFLVAVIKGADLSTLFDLLTATPMPAETRDYLAGQLAKASELVVRNRSQLAVRALKRFGAEVAHGWGTGIPAGAAEELITRTVSVIEALGF